MTKNVLGCGFSLTIGSVLLTIVELPCFQFWVVTYNEEVCPRSTSTAEKGIVQKGVRAIKAGKVQPEIAQQKCCKKNTSERAPGLSTDQCEHPFV